MIYIENASYGAEGFNTHVMSYSLAISLSNFLERDFYFDFEVASSCPPDSPSDPEYQEMFRILLESPRSQVSDLVSIPNRRVFSVDRDVSNKKELQLLHSYFLTTEELKRQYEGTIIWDSFAVGRHALTREQLNETELIDWTHTKLTTPAYFYFLRPDEKRELLDSVKLRYIEPIENLADSILDRFNTFYSCHFRLNVFLLFFENYLPEIERFRDYVRVAFPDTSLPILISTEALHKKEIAQSIFRDYEIIFIDELIFNEFNEEYAALPFTDFNVLTVLNQLICARGERFIGTYQSTFTAIIHRLRQERYGKRDFNYFPDPKVEPLVSVDNKIVPDQHGFFEWNRYSAFAEDHAAIAWMREWDHQLSTINL